MRSEGEIRSARDGLVNLLEIMWAREAGDELHTLAPKTERMIEMLEWVLGQQNEFDDIVPELNQVLDDVEFVRRVCDKIEKRWSEMESQSAPDNES